MLADVHVMCIGGRRIPRERLKIMQPIRGELSVTRRRDPWRNEWVPIAVLRHDGARDLPALDQVRISRWSGANLLLVGVEHGGRPKQSRPQLQAWWVQLVTDPGQARGPAGGGLAADSSCGSADGRN
jgi:hypothetical protein